MDPGKRATLTRHDRTLLQRARTSAIGLILFLAALAVLHQELRGTTWLALTDAVLDTSTMPLSMAVVLTMLDYTVLTGYDFLAFAYIGRQLSWARMLIASFLGHAIANSAGSAMISDASVRYRLYSRWGVTSEELSQFDFADAVTFWLGLLLLGGLSVAEGQLPAAFEVPDAVARFVGWASVLASIAYITTTFVRRAPVRFGRVELSLPTPQIAAAQLMVSAFDWTLAAAALYALLPASRLSFLALLGAFVIGQLMGRVSYVPGGIGVFEATMVLLLKPFLGPAAVLPALVVYRGVSYLLPLTAALLLLVADELHQRRAEAARMSALLGRMTEELAPRVLSLFTFLSGAILLFSGATPATGGRLAILARVVPVGVIEASHFIGSVLGAALLVLSQGLARRLDAAYLLALTAIALGIVTSLLKGVDYEEALALTLVLLVLWRARPAFDRRAAFFDTRFSAGWIFAIAGVVSASTWIGFFAFRHVEYSNELWWHFGVHGEASRFLRGLVGSAVFLLLVAFARLLAPAAHEVVEPTDADLEAATQVIERQPWTFPYLVFLRDKAVLFDDQCQGFVMYGVQGRTWVALGDPVGPPDRMPDLIRRFLERCDDFDGVPVFYEVRKDHLHHYADFGLTFVKLGEEARVDLTTFTLAGGHFSKQRQNLRRLEKAGVAFRVVGREEAATIMDRLRVVSDEWLAAKAGGEKGFSLGFFGLDYLSRFDIAVMERDGEIIAFANLWTGPQQFELATDLIRYRRSAPPETMEALLLHVMTWGKPRGYRWFSLGVAPLSGFERSPVAPLWSRVGSFLYAHGEAFYHFRGLRAFKEKFHPQWEPRYLVYPGGLRLPRIAADVSALIAGGYRKVVLK